MNWEDYGSENKDIASESERMIRREEVTARVAQDQATRRKRERLAFGLTALLSTAVVGGVAFNAKSSSQAATLPVTASLRQSDDGAGNLFNNPKIPDGSSIKCAGSDEPIYRWTDGKRRAYPSDEVAQSWDPEYDVDVHEVDCTDIPEGSPMSPKGELVAVVDAKQPSAIAYTRGEDPKPEERVQDAPAAPVEVVDDTEGLTEPEAPVEDSHEDVDDSEHAEGPVEETTIPAEETTTPTESDTPTEGDTSTKEDDQVDEDEGSPADEDGTPSVGSDVSPAADSTSEVIDGEPTGVDVDEVTGESNTQVAATSEGGIVQQAADETGDDVAVLDPSVVGETPTESENVPEPNGEGVSGEYGYYAPNHVGEVTGLTEEGAAADEPPMLVDEVPRFEYPDALVSGAGFANDKISNHVDVAEPSDATQDNGRFFHLHTIADQVDNVPEQYGYEIAAPAAEQLPGAHADATVAYTPAEDAAPSTTTYGEETTVTGITSSAIEEPPAAAYAAIDRLPVEDSVKEEDLLPTETENHPEVDSIPSAFDGSEPEIAVYGVPHAAEHVADSTVEGVRGIDVPVADPEADTESNQVAVSHNNEPVAATESEVGAAPDQETDVYYAEGPTTTAGAEEEYGNVAEEGAAHVNENNVGAESVATEHSKTTVEADVLKEEEPSASHYVVESPAEADYEEPASPVGGAVEATEGEYYSPVEEPGVLPANPANNIAYGEPYGDRIVDSEPSDHRNVDAELLHNTIQAEKPDPESEGEGESTGVRRLRA